MFESCYTHPNTLAHELCVFLESNGIGTYTGTPRNIFRGFFPESPDEAVAVYVGGGRGEDRNGIDYNVSIQTRANKRVDSLNLQMQIWDVLGEKKFFGNTGPYQLATSFGKLSARNAPGIDFLDDEKRTIHVLSYTFIPT